MKLLTTAPKYLSDAAAPLITLNYLMGVRVFKYPRGKPGIVLSLFYLLFLLGIFCVCVNTQRKFYLNVKLLKLEYALYEFMGYTNASIVVYEMIFSWFYTKRFNACYRKIAQVDDTLRQLGSTFNYRNIYFLTVGVLIIWFLYIVVSSIMTTIYLPVNTRTSGATISWLIVAHVYGISISFIVILEFSIFVKSLQIKFKLVNKLLSESTAASTTEEMKLNLFAAEDYAKIMDTEDHKHIFFTKMFPQVNRQLQSRVRNSVSKKRNPAKSRFGLPSQLKKQFQMELQSQSGNQTKDTDSIQRSVVIAGCRKRKHLLQTIKQVHLELCRVSKMICTSYGVQITSEIAISIMVITGMLYTWYVRLIHHKNTFRLASNNLFDKLIVAMTITITYTLKIIFINRVCKNATDEGKKTTEVIHAICKCCEDVDIREEIQQFSLQILQNPVDFSAFGISLNYQIISSCLKTVTTYLVIMVQVGNSLESNKSIREIKNN